MYSLYVYIIREIANMTFKCLAGTMQPPPDQEMIKKFQIIFKNLKLSEKKGMYSVLGNFISLSTQEKCMYFCIHYKKL